MQVLIGSSAWLTAGQMGRCDPKYRGDGFEVIPFLQKWILSNLPGALQLIS